MVRNVIDSEEEDFKPDASVLSADGDGSFEEDTPEPSGRPTRQRQQQGQLPKIKLNLGKPQPAPTVDEYDEDADGEPDDEFNNNYSNQHPNSMVKDHDDFQIPPDNDGGRYPRRTTRASNNSQHSQQSYELDQPPVPRTTRSGRGVAATYNEDEIQGDEDDDEDIGPRRPKSGRSTSSKSRSAPRRRSPAHSLDGFVELDEDERRDKERFERERSERRTRQAEKRKSQQRSPKKKSRANESDDAYHGGSASDDDDESDPVPTSPSLHNDDDDPSPPQAGRRTLRKRGGRQDSDQEEPGYKLRERNNKVNYRIPLIDENLPVDPKDFVGTGKSRPKPRRSAANGFNVSFALQRPPGQDSDSDDFTRTPRKVGGLSGANGNMLAGGVNDSAAAAGTPSNLGRITASSAAALADVDPLGVNQNVSFEDVGGLDEHISSLKEMTLLPLLYPELFMRFGVTPPRGVLFHGPPGTGKTLLARALAASSRSGGRSVAFFMRKGADCLSKWVGEAERQLRLLFEEARNAQPSIIFFDEIDGLAPVRSSKQDQIHASIVSTLLALMDGMDGRGQVVVIGATNRPDAVDPALRRPGRFDREFYFPLPNAVAREKILGIHTRGWDGWTGDEGKELIHGLAKVTKGYGGADLRALCTEAALNAVQRRYPQIYKSSERLVVKPETVRVEPRDFMISVKKLVPSSARSASSAAAPLPTQLVPLLEEPLNKIKGMLDRAIPPQAKRSVLEEAEWEDDIPDNAPSEQGALQREVMRQSLETLRIHRPRLAVHGPAGMGQAYLGAAALHHLESYNVQSLDIGALLSDSTRTVEAAIVQLFVEAKRHQPSIVYIPSLVGWCAAVSETARTTTRAMLDSMAPTDPILLLAIIDGPWTDLPRDVRAWFGPSSGSRIALTAPSMSQREAFFHELMNMVRKPPTEFPDAVKRRKRVLEELPIAPPLAPKQMTEAELRALEQSDALVIAQLKHRLGPVIMELKRRHKRFCKSVLDEYDYDRETGLLTYIPPPGEIVEEYAPPSSPTPMSRPMDVDQDELQLLPAVDASAQNLQQQPPAPEVNGVNGHVDPAAHHAPEAGPSDLAPVPVAPAPEAPVAAPEPVPTPPPQPKLHFVDLERITMWIYNGKYLTPDDFLVDINKIVENALLQRHVDIERWTRSSALYNQAQIMISEIEPAFVAECLRMAPRQRKRDEEEKRLRREAKQASKNLTDDAAASGSALTRTSVRRSGLQPEVAMTDPSKLERTLKRQRSTDDTVGDLQGTGENDSRDSKRARISGDEEAAGELGHVDLSMQIDLVAGSSSNAMLAPEPLVPMAGSASLANLLNPIPAGPYGQASEPNGPTSGEDVYMSLEFAHASTSAGLLPIVPATIKEPSPPARTPTPMPPFTLDESLARAFERKVAEQTNSLTVEQLEALRALCFDCVWRHRAEWDRDAAVREMGAIVDEFLQEVSYDEADEEV